MVNRLARIIKVKILIFDFRLHHRYTSNAATVYAIFSDWPSNDSIGLSVNKHIDLSHYRVLLLNDRGGSYLKFRTDDDSAVISLQKTDLLYSRKPWVLKFEPVD